jgi:glycosyltransferase involved in cell wall biosynthesis
MRILWLSPWLRTLARVQAEALGELGHDVLLVTSDQHPQSGAARPYELVLTPRPKTPATWPEFVRARRIVHDFAPEVVVAELVRDPRWMLLGRGRPRVTAVHDDRPHDAAEARPHWEQVIFDRWASRADATVAFSHYVAGALGGGAEVVALTSDLPEAQVPLPAPAGERRDFVVFGRLNPYKNLAVTFAAWRRHVSGPAYRGDELVLLGDGDLPEPLPERARWVRGSFDYVDAVAHLRAAKGSLVHYRQASQSGVQLVSMQLGVVPIVSGEGALPEFQPAGETPIGRDDVAGLAAALDILADPDVAAERGARARAHYGSSYSAIAAARRWQQVLGQVVAGSVHCGPITSGPGASIPR